MTEFKKGLMWTLGIIAGLYMLSFISSIATSQGWHMPGTQAWQGHRYGPYELIRSDGIAYIMRDQQGLLYPIRPTGRSRAYPQIGRWYWLRGVAGGYELEEY